MVNLDAEYRYVNTGETSFGNLISLLILLLPFEHIVGIL